MKHGKKFGNRSKGSGFNMQKFTKESQEQYLASAAEIETTYNKALYAAEKGYKEFLRDLERGRKEAYEAAARQLIPVEVSAEEAK